MLEYFEEASELVDPGKTIDHVSSLKSLKLAEEEIASSGSKLVRREKMLIGDKLPWWREVNICHLCSLNVLTSSLGNRVNGI